MSPTRSQGDIESWHTGLALAGMIPGVGAVPDLLDALLYAAEGRWGEAGDSVVSAAPIGGDLYRASTATRKVVGAVSDAAKAGGSAAKGAGRAAASKPPGGMEAIAPTRPYQLMELAQKNNKAKRYIEAVHTPHVPGQQPHVHFQDGTSLNLDGTIHDKKGGVPSPPKAVREFLEEHGWSGEVIQ